MIPNYFTKTLDRDYENAIKKVRQALEQEGFKTRTDIDVSETSGIELGVEFEKYRILGACSFSHANGGLKVEKKNCPMLPGSIIVYEAGNGCLDMVVTDPMASVKASDSLSLCEIAYQVSGKLEYLIEKL